ncbi:MAG: DNA cytosine methyltransferase [Chloroflexota bacterium]
MGLERAGMTCKWQVENDLFCNKVLTRHWPEVQRYGDIKDFPPDDIFRPGIIVGGPPCQPYSVAGKRRGPADDRSLWPEFLRVIGKLKPNWALVENVPGVKSIGVPVGLPHVVSRSTARLEDSDEYASLFTQQERMYLDLICDDLEAIGYEVVPLIIPAAAFGAPHLRYRVFVVAHTDRGCSQRAENPVCTRGHSLSYAVKLWPTPTVHGNYNRRGASESSGDGLATAVKMYPTPTARDYKGEGFPGQLGTVAKMWRTPSATVVDQVGGQLNPEFVGWLMGFPIGWTDLELSETP